MGQVYLGLSAGKRAVAIKVIHARHARDKEFRARFRTEVAAARRVNAAFTAPVIDAGEDDDPPWLVTALVPGPSVADLVSKHGPLSTASAWRLIAGLAEALQAVHACDLVHRDLKPENVLLAADGPRLIDFGLSRALDAIGLTATGYVMGTPAFMSPEQADGRPMGPASDVFSLAAVVVFATTGLPPFGFGQSVDVLYRISQNEPELGQLTGPLRDLMVRCLAKEPSTRPIPEEIMRSVPDHTALSSVVQFWPTSVNELILDYQSRFAAAVAAPAGTPSPDPMPAQPYRPPREIAAQAAEFTDSGQAEKARQLLSSTARLRPDQEVAALIMILHSQRRHGDIDTVTGAVMQRSAPEVAALADVLRQIGSDDEANRLLDQAGQRPPEEVVAIASVLAQQDKTTEVRRLLHSAITAHRTSAAIAALVKGLSSAGLGQENARLMGVATAGLPTADTAALADALYAAGQREAAFTVYSAATDLISLRPPAAIASLLRAMRDAGRATDANRLIDAACSRARQPSEIAGLATALWSAALDVDALRVMNTVASVMAVDDVIVIVESLLTADRPDAALRLCIESAAQRPAEIAVSLVQTLREAGRPIDARQVFASSRTWPPQKVAQLVVSLRGSSADSDADQVLAAARQRPASEVSEVMAELILLGAERDGARLVGLDQSIDDLGQLCDLISAQLGDHQEAAADRLLAMTVAQGPERCCDMIEEFVSRGTTSALGPLFRLQAPQDTATVLRLLRQRGNDRAIKELLLVIALRPIEEVTAFIGRSSITEEDATELIFAMRGRGDAEIGSAIAAYQPQAGRTGRDFLLALAYNPRMRVAPLIDAIQISAPELLGDLLTAIIRRNTGAGAIGQLIAYLRAARLDYAKNQLLATAAAQLDGRDFCALYRDLLSRQLAGEANYLITQAPISPDINLLAKAFKDEGYAGEAKLIRKLGPRR